MEKIVIAVDAAGGDYAPAAPVAGCLEALSRHQDIDLVLYGNEAAIRAELAGKEYDADRISVVDCTEQIAMAEPPVAAIRKKKDSSIVKGMMSVRRGEAHAFISSGSTGAVLAGGHLLVGRLKGIERPPLGVLMPTAKGTSLLIDCGANVDARPSWLVQFAEMGSIYYGTTFGKENPTVAIVNIGAEEEKGNALVKETFPLLKANENINFIGSIEARDIPAGMADVIVCDAFVGNVILKEYEGVASMLLKMVKKSLMSDLRSKAGALLIKPALKRALKDFDISEYGGAPLLGLKGLVVKAHGNASAREFGNAIDQCRDFYGKDINGKIAARLCRDDKETK